MISGKARLAGVMGWPIQHSQSPRLHGYWLDRYEIDGAYVPLSVHPENFETAFRALPTLGFAGVNITVPHKELALKLVERVDPTAQRIGAVNTVVITDDGDLMGYNTDAIGFIENLRQGYPTFKPDVGPAVVLGAGGAARAVICGLLDAGVVDLKLVNRTRERAETLAESLAGFQAGPLPSAITVFDFSEIDEALDGAHLLVNTTSLGMDGKPPLDICLDALPKAALVNDIVYAPLQTDLLKSARERGNPTVDGLGMLLHQACAGFEKWFGVLPDVTDELRHHILKGMDG